jgi:alginate O-acetyltransferase complex protein AlgI
MGGNKTNMYRNLIVVWFLTGLWHGASWNFILWGLYFGALIGFERIFLAERLKKLPVFVSHLYLILAVVFGWSIFYFTDLSQLFSFIGVMSGISGHAFWDINLNIQLKANLVWLLTAMVFCMPVTTLVKEQIGKYLTPQQRQVVPFALAITNVVMLLTSVAFLVGKSYNPFLYFRF